MKNLAKKAYVLFVNYLNSKELGDLGEDLIYGHAGKRLVYESYKRVNSEIAQKYLEFVARNPEIQIIRWNEEKRKFEK